MWTPLFSYADWKIEYGFASHRREVAFGGDVTMEAADDAREDVLPIFASGSLDVHLRFFGLTTLPDLRAAAAHPLADAIARELGEAQKVARGLKQP